MSTEFPRFDVSPLLTSHEVGHSHLSAFLNLENRHSVEGTAISGFELGKPLQLKQFFPGVVSHPPLSDIAFASSVERKGDSLLGDHPFLVGDSNELDDLTHRNLSATTGREIVFVDSAVEDYQSLIASVPAEAEIIRLDSNQDGVQQIASLLAGQHDIQAIHIVAHGSNGALQLGNTSLNAETLKQYTRSLQVWGQALTLDGDILLYGCNVAKDEAGQKFTREIADITKADVAASDDLTGDAALNGDWNLEYQQGIIDASTLSGTNYQHTLATTSLTNGKFIYESADNYSVTIGSTSTKYDYQNQINLSISGSDLVITEENTTGDYSETITAGTGVTQVNSYSVKVALSSITSGIQIKTLSGQDAITFTSALTSFSNATSLSVETGSGGDTITFGADISTSGGAISIDGGSGGDTITFNSAVKTAGGSISLYGKDGDDTFTLSGSISTAGGAFSISGDDNSDTVTLGNSLYTQGGNVDIAANTITVNAGSTLSTRKISGTDHSTAVSTGNSGSISLTGQEIAIGSSTGTTQIFSQADGNYTAGSIRFITSEIEAAATGFDGTETSKATIALNKVTLKGGDVTLSADADYAGTFDDSTSLQNATIGFLDNFSLVGGAALAKSVATITIDSSTDISVSTLTASSTATTNATIYPLFSYILGGAYGRSDATAKVTIAGTVTSTGDVSISTKTDNTVDVEVSTSKWDSTNAVTNSAAAAAISELYSESTAEITDTAKITITDGDLSVTSDTIDRNYTTAKSKTSSNGVLAIAAAISLEDGSTNALIDGTVNVSGNITVDAAQKKDVVKKTATLASTDGVIASAGVTDLSSDYLSGLVSTAGSDLWDKLMSLITGKSSSAKTKTKNKSASFQIGSAVAYVEDTNNVTARIGGKTEDGDATDLTAANVTAKGNLTIQATAENRPDVSATSALNSTTTTTSSSTDTSTTQNKSDFAGSAAVAIGDYTNTVRAYIGDSATVNVKQALSINADALSNYSAEWGVNLVEPFTENKPWYEQGYDFLTNLSGYLNNNLGLDKYVFDTWSQATASSDAKLSVAGAATILSLDHTVDAYIAQNANINQDTTLRSDQQTVSIDANSLNESVQFGGNIQLPGISSVSKTYKPKFSVGGVGTDGDNAVGGTVLVIDYMNDVSATIADKVSLYADSLSVKANTDVMDIAIAASGGQAKTFGFSGTGTWVYVDNDTDAQINDGASIVVGDNLAIGTDVSLVVNAIDTSNVINVMGGVTTAENIGAGATIGFNTLDRKTRAVIGNFSDSGEANLTGTTQSSGKVKINASNDGYIGSFSLAAAVSKESTDTDDADEAEESAGYGLSLSGDVAFNEVTDTTEAYVQDVALTATSSAIDITATNDSDIMAIGGAIAITVGQEDSTASAGLAGSYGQNTVTQTTNAYVDNSVVTSSELTISADNTSDIYAVVAGGSGTTNSDTNVAIAGAVAINDIDNDTQADISYSTATITGAISVSAADQSTLHADAGGASLSVALNPDTANSISAGVGISNNEITNDIAAFIDDYSTITKSSSIAISAISNATVDAFALGGAASVSSSGLAGGVSLAGAGAGSVNDIENTINAYISSGSSVTSSGAVAVTATDTSKITADSGGYAIAASLGASAKNFSLSLGVSTADNEIANTIKATIDNATVKADGNLNLQALSTATVDALGIGGSLSTSSSSGTNISLSGAGSGVENTINNTIAATIQDGSTVTTNNSGNISLTATDSSKITSDAGGVAIALGIGSTSFGVSAGASVGMNKIGNVGHTIKAAIDNSTVTASGNLELDATSNATIDAVTFSGAAAGSGGTGAGLNFTGTAAISDNSIKSNIQAVIQNVGSGKSVKTTNGSIQLNALDNSEITSDAGGATLALSFGSGGAAGLSVGFSVATNTTTNTTQALINAATVNAKTTLDLSAKSTSFIDTFALGGAAAGAAGSGGSVALSGAGAGSYSTMTNTTEAAILYGSDVDAGGALTIQANDTSDRTNGKKLDTLAVGGSAAVSGGAGGSGSIAVSAVVVDNTLNNKTRAYIGLDGVTADTTTVDAASVSLTATSNPIIEAEAVAVSVAAAFSKVGAALAGGGANVTNTLTNTIAALIQGGSTVTATTGSINLTATDTPNITGGIGSGALSIGAISASIAISLTDTTIDNTITAAIEAAKVTANNGNITLDADSTPTIDNTVVATSVSAGLGSSVAGGDAAGTVSSDVAAYVGDKATVNTKTLNVWADSNSSVTNEAYGVGAAIAAAIGVSTAESTVNGSTKAYVGSNAAYVTGTTVNATGINLAAKATGEAETSTTAIAGGIVASGSGNDATSTFSPTVEAFIGNSTTLNVTGDVSVTATAQPKAEADSFGVSASVGVATGFSFASATIDPTVNAFVGQNSKVTAKNLTLLAQQILPGSGYSTEADSSGSGGALLGSYNSSDSDAINYGNVSAYVGNSSTLTITDSASIAANAKSTQNAYADGYNAGILAGGFNPAYAATNITTQSYIGSGVTINAGSFTLKAIGNSDNFADAKSGGGGLISGRASEAETKDISTTKVYLNYDPTKTNNTNNSTTTINASSVTITADNTTTFNSRADSINASIVGGSGALATNTIDATVEVNLGSKVNVTTENLLVNANNTIDKSALDDQNVEAGSGGIVDGSAVIAKTTITNQTQIIVGDNTTLKVTGEATNPGDFSLTATNNVTADEDAKIETGGLVPVAGAEATIQNNTNIAQIQIGNADLTSVGDIDLATVSAATLDTYAKAKVWGLAGGPIGTTLTELTATNAIVLLNGAYLEAAGDVNLEAGKDANIVQEDINLNAYTYLFNGTASTGTTPKSDANLTLNNTITINSGAVINSIGNVNLTASKGDVKVDAETLGQSSLGEAAEAVASWFGADVSTEVTSGSDTDESISSKVQVNGVVTAGFHNQQYLYINETSNVLSYTHSDGVDQPTSHQEDIGATINAKIDALEVEYNSTSDTTERAGIQAEIDFWNSQLTTLGISGNSSSGTVIEVPEITASSGDISVTAGNLMGSGTLTANSDTKITIINNSSKYLRVNNLTIPNTDGGRLLFNQASVSSQSDVSSRNLDSSSVNLAIHTDANSAEPTITIQGTTSAAIEIAGTITNLQGTVALSNDSGSIFVLGGDISASTIDVDAGDSFYLSDGYIYQTGASPEAQWLSDTATVAADAFNNLKYSLKPSSTYSGSTVSTTLADTQFNYSTTTGYTLQSTTGSFPSPTVSLAKKVTDATTISNRTSNSGSLIAANGIFLNAQYLNVNGLIQSGKPDRSITLDSSLNSIISTFKTQYSTNQAASSKLDLSPYISSDYNIKAYYNAGTNRIEVEDVDIQGGYIQLVGKVASTGNGSIKALDGYGKISINNQTSYDLEVADLDTGGEGIEGKVSIIDQWKTGYDGGPLTTTYTRNDSGQIVITTNATAAGTTQTLNTSATSYTPTSSFYVWQDTTLRDVVVRETFNYTLSGGSSGTISYTSQNNASVLSSTVTFKSGITQAFYTDPNSNVNGATLAVTTYSLGQTVLAFPHNNPTATLTSKVSLYQGTYNRVESDSPINIGFVGYTTGSIDVTSTKNVYLNGDITNAIGDTTITTSGGGIQSLDSTLDITTKNLTLNASGGIGTSSQSIRTDLQGGSLTATAIGDIYITETDGDLTVNTITATAGDVTLVAENDILAASASSKVAGQSVSLTAQTGSVGITGSPLSIDTGATTAIGESGSVSNLTNTDQTITFKHTYHNPVVFALPPSYNNTDAAIVRITNVTSTGFTAHIDEPDSTMAINPQIYDNIHGAESFSYIVLEAGTWELPDGRQIEVGKVNSDHKNLTYWQSVNFTQDFQGVPILFSQLQSQDSTDYNFRKTRVKNLSVDGFQVETEYEQRVAGGSTDSIGYLAFDSTNSSSSAASFATSTWDNSAYILGSTGNAVTDSWSTLTFGNQFTSIPNFIASLSSFNETDPAELRFQNLGTNSVQVKVEEDLTVDLNTTHSAENIHYFAIKANSTLSAQGSNKTLTVSAAGDINLKETSGDLNLVSVTSSTGNVNIEATNGAILDCNTTETEDTAAKQTILDTVWQELHLTSAYGAQDSIDAEVTAYERAQDYLYEIYWQERNLTRNSDGSYTADAYNANATYTLTSSQNAHLQAYGYANYQALHNALASKGLTTSYNSNYSYTASSSEIKSLSSGGVWSQEALENTLNPGLLLPVSDTETTIEADNITGRNLSLTAKGIGGKSDSTILDLAAIKAQGGATDAQLLAFLTAERSDVTYYDSQGNEITDAFTNSSSVAKIVIGSVEDLDVTATGTLTVSSTGDVAIGSEKDITLNQVQATGYDVRIKTGDGIYVSPNNTSLSTHIKAADLVLEAGDESIGSSTDPIIVEISGALTARANNDIYIIDKSGNLDIEQVYAGDSVNLTSAGAFTDANNNEDEDIRSKVINLNNTSSVGSSTNYLDLYLESSGSLSLNTSRNAYIHAVSTDNTLNVNFLGHNGVITNSTIVDTTTGTTIGYSGFSTVNIDFGLGTNTFAVQSLSATTSLNLNSSSGTDTFTIGNSSSINASQILGTVAIDGGTGQTTLVLDNSASTTTGQVNVTDSGVAAFGLGAIAYTTSLENIKIYSGSQADTFNVASLANINLLLDGGTGINTFNIATITGGAILGTLTLQGGAGEDTFNFGNSSASTLANLQGPVNVFGGGLATDDTIYINESNTSSIPGVVSNAAITGFLPGTINYDSIGTINIPFGISNASINIDSLLSATTLKLDDLGNFGTYASGFKTINIGGNTANSGSVNGNVYLGLLGLNRYVNVGNAQVANNIVGNVYINSKGTSAAHRYLSLIDRADTTANTVTLDVLNSGSYYTTQAVAGLFPGTVYYDSSSFDSDSFTTFEGGIDLYLGSGNDTLTINRVNTPHVTIHLGAGDDKATVAQYVPFVTIEGEAGNDNIDASANWYGTTIDGGDGNDVIRGSYFKSGFDSKLTGGAGDDIIIGHGEGSAIDAGMGSDIVWAKDSSNVINTAGDGSSDILFLKGNGGDIYTIDTGLDRILNIGSYTPFLLEQGTNILGTTSQSDFGTVGINGGTADQTFTVKNILDVPVSLDSLSITNSGIFSIVNNTVSASLGAGETASFTVRYTPTEGGTQTAGLEMGPYSVDLSGTGLAQEINVRQGTTNLANNGSFSFDTFIYDGSQITQDVTFTIENLGGAALDLSSISIWDPNKEHNFALVGTVPTGLLAVGTSTDITVRFQPQYSWNVSQTYSDYLRISSNDVDESNYQILLTGKTVRPEVNFMLNGTDLRSPSSVNFDDFEVDNATGTLTVTVQNQGASPLTIKGIDSSTLPEEYEMTFEGLASGDVIPAYSSSNLTFHLDAKPNSFYPGNFFVAVATDVYTDDLDEGFFRFNFLAKVLVPEINLKQGTSSLSTNASQSFGSVDINTGMTDMTFTIENLGDATLYLDNIGINGNNASDFTLIGTLPTSVAAHQSTPITVRFDPTAVGDRTAVLTINNNDHNDRFSNEYNYFVNLAGTGYTLPTLALTNSVNAIAESTDTSSSIKVADLAVDYAGLNSYNLTLSGADADKFEIVNNELFLKAGTKLDYETQSQFKVNIEADDPAFGSTPDSSVELLIDITDINEAPTLTLSNILTTLPELANTTTPIKVADIAISDDALGSNTLSLSGANANKFEIIGKELYLRAGTVLDYETQSQLKVTVAVDDPTVGSIPDASVNLAIAIINVNEAPTLALTNTVASLTESTSTATSIKVADIVLSDDALGSNTLMLSGADAKKFEIISKTLYLKAGTALDYETQSKFAVTVSVDDPTVGSTPDASINLAIAITDSNEAPSISLANTVLDLSDTTNTTSRLKVADINISDDALGAESLTLTGVDADKFEIVGTGLYLKAGALLNHTTQPQLDVTVTLDDPTVGSSPDASVNLAIAITKPELSLQQGTFALGDGATQTFAKVDTATGLAEMSFTLENTSNEPLDLTGITIGGINAEDFTFVGTVPSGQLAAGAMTTLTIRFNPSAVGTRIATLTLTSQDQYEDIYTITLVGTGTNTSSYTGTSGNDTIISQGGNSTIIAGAGNDLVIGGSSTDDVVAGEGDDQVTGHRGGDRINGDMGDDILIGSTGKDVLDGGTGNDTLKGGWGSDSQTGGEGADLFLYQGTNCRQALSGSLIRSMDVITDFDNTEGDRIQLDYDNDLTTANIPKALFNAGQQHGRSLTQAARSAFEDCNRRKKGKQSLRSNQAVLFQWKGRTFLCVNDNNAKFLEKRDFIVEVTGIVMQPKDSKRVKLTVNQYFI